MKIKLRKNHGIIAILIFLLILVGGSVPISSGKGAGGHGLFLTNQTKTGLTLELRSGQLDIQTVRHGDVEYALVTLPGSSPVGLPGEPGIPSFHTMVGAPAGAVVEIDVQYGKPTEVTLPDALLPMPQAVASAINFEPGKVNYQAQLDAYRVEGFLPSELVRISDDMWVRYQRVIQLEIFPVQYEPTTGKILFYPEMSVALTFVQNEQPDQQHKAPTEIKDGPFEQLLADKLINYEQALAWRAAPVSNQPNDLRNALDVEPGLKVVVDEDGIYEVGYADLVNAGMDIDSIDPRYLQLTNMEEPVAIWIPGEGDGSFDPGDKIIFYGEEFDGDRFQEKFPDDRIYWLFDNLGTTAWPGYQYPADVSALVRDPGAHHEKYTHENVYWLREEQSQGLRMATADGAPGSAPTATSYLETARAEQANNWWSWHFTQEDTWFWERISYAGTTVLTKTYTIDLSAPAALPISSAVRANLIAQSYSGSINPDHHAALAVNGSRIIADEWWDGRTRQVLEGQINQADLVDGANQVSIGILKVAGVPVQTIFFDWIEVDYQRSFQVINNVLEFGGDQAGAWQYPVTGFTDQQISLLDITNPIAPIRILNGAVSGNGVYTLTFEHDHMAGARYFASSASAYKNPKTISFYSPDDLLSPLNGADYIIITHDDFLTPSQELADYRASQGLRARVVNIEDVYNQFSGGIFNPAAIRNFLQYAFVNWAAPAPSYVVLVGDGHWNFHGDGVATYGEPRPIYLPPYLVWADPWQGEVDSANMLAAFVGTDVIPDVLISRIPVDSTAQMAVVTEKIIQFEQTGDADWQRRAVFVADNADNAGPFNLESDALIQAGIPDYVAVERYYLDDYPECPITPPDGYPATKSLCPRLTNALTNTLNTSGALFVNYIGHGKDYMWAAEKLLHKDEFGGVNNPSMMPVFVDMTCLTGYYYHAKYPGEFSMSVELLRTAGKGAVGTFSPTGLGVSTGHGTLSDGFYQALYTDNVKIFGLAALSGKMDLFQTSYNFDLINTFTIFGDPALILPTGPAYSPEITVNPVTRQGLPGESIDYLLEITNAGIFADSIDLQVNLADWGTVLSVETLADMLSGETRNVILSVQIPEEAFGGDFDQITVAAVSQSDPLVLDSQVLLTQVMVVYDGAVSPQDPTRFGPPGEKLEYFLALTNAGTMIDTYELSLSGGNWQSMLSSEILSLLPGRSEFFIVSVEVPDDAVEGEQDQVYLQVFSSESNQVVDEVKLSSAVVLEIRKLFLPVARRDAVLP